MSGLTITLVVALILSIALIAVLITALWRGRSRVDPGLDLSQAPASIVVTYIGTLQCAQCGRPWTPATMGRFEMVPVRFGELACALMICRSHERGPVPAYPDPSPTPTAH